MTCVPESSRAAFEWERATMNRNPTATRIAALLLAAAVPLAAQEPAKSPAPAAVAGGAYKVATHRPYSKGQRYTMTMQASVHQEGAIGPSPDKMEGGAADDAISIVAKVTVMDVNSVGEATMMMVHMDKAQAGPKDKVKAMAVEGGDLGLSLVKGRFRVTARDGRKVPEEEQMWLSMIFEPPTGVPSDEVLGPGKEVRVGDSWPINREAWSKSLAAMGGEGQKAPDPTKLEGKVTLVGVEDWGGVPCLHLKVEQTDKSGEVPNFTGEFFNQINQDLWVPVDTKLPKTRVEGEQLNRLNGKVHSKDGALLNMRQQTKVAFKATIE